MKTKILFARPCLGSHRQEVANALIEIATITPHDPRIEDVMHCPIERVPTPVARNLVVKVAREARCGIIFMVDDDMWPVEGFFKSAIDFLLSHEGPAAIASPYVTGGPQESVCVFEWSTDRSSGGKPAPGAPFSLVNIVREDAARRNGIERVVNIGTGYIAYKTECFDKIDHPYFQYSYSDKTHTRVTETEDCYCHRKMYFADVPLYVDWDHWSKHRKSYWAEKPWKLSEEDIASVYMQQARAELVHGGKDLSELVPKDVEGWSDFAEIYEMAVKEGRDGARFVEVGSYQGRSAILMARLIERSKKQIRFTCVDHFQGSAEHHGDGIDCIGLRAKFEANLEKHGVARTVEVLPVASVEASKMFLDESLDFVFLDASHDEDSVRADIAAWLPKVRMNGVLAGHDFNFLEVAMAVSTMLPSETVDIKGRSWVYRKK